MATVKNGEIVHRMKKYSQENRIEIMHLHLTKFNGSWEKTKKVLGIPINTMKKWAEDADLMVEVKAYGEIMSKRNALSVDMAEMVDVQILSKNAIFLDEAFKVKEQALKKAAKLITKTNSLRDITSLIELLHNITEQESSSDKSKEQPGDVLYQQIINLHQHGSTAIQRNTKE
jgi:hypothetical protein